jgi:hypothetical protein
MKRRYPTHEPALSNRKREVVEKVPDRYDA